MPKPIRYRRSPHVVCYWKAGEFIFHNYATNRRAGAAPIACEVLDFFGDWKPLSELSAARPGVARPALKQLLDTLVALTLLHRSDRENAPAEQAMDMFGPWNPEAGLFHTATKDVRFIDAETSGRELQAQAAAWPMPSPTKRYPGAPVVTLPQPAHHGPVDEALLARRTWRRFGKGTIPLATFSTLLGLTAGVQQWVSVTDYGEVPLKTSPSGGARHPVEVYVLAWGVEGLARGLYHYAADVHALEVIQEGMGPERIPEYFPQGGYFAEASAVVLFSAVYERDLWRYPYSRAYRAPLIEAGHLCQTFCLLATTRGLAPFSLMGLADSAIERDLRVDGIHESVLYAAGVGVLPEEADWAPAPPGFRVPAVRPNRKLRRP
ncbi:MAG: SagB family peptide dehydrogenase [Acidobacteria bacterium]|nr:SagB family peptide dehydrogenase [Acidobacteriota bacterium]